MPQPESFPISDHQRASNMMEYALTLGDPDVWLGAINVFKVRLTDSELASMGFAISKAQDPEHAALTAEAVLGRPDTPDVPFLSAMDQASFWADTADPAYVEACVIAGFNRMPPNRQAAFLNHIQGRIAA